MADSIILTHVCNLDKAQTGETLRGALYATENQAHTFVITGQRGGVAVAFAGSVTGVFMRADGGSVELTGGIEDGAAVITLAQSCYTVEGRFTLTVFNVDNGIKTTIYRLTGQVARTTTNTIIDPGNVIPDVDAIIAEYAKMEQTVADAETATTAALSAAHALEPTVRALHKLVDYTGEDGSTSVSGITAAMTGERLTLNGTQPASSRLWVCLNSIAAARASSTVNGWANNPIALTAGHTYKAMLWQVGGEATGGNVELDAVVIGSGTIASVGTGVMDGNAYVRTFKAEEGKTYNLIARVSNGAYTFTNAEYMAVVEDVTETAGLEAKIAALQALVLENIGQ